MTSSGSAAAGASGRGAAAFDPREPGFAADPYPAYAALRAAGRVHRLPSIGEWWVVGYADARAVLEDRRLGRQLPSEAAVPPLPVAALGGAPLPASILRLEPPDHTRLRALVTRAFTPRVVADLRPRIEQIADELLDVAAP